MERSLENPTMNESMYFLLKKTWIFPQTVMLVFRKIFHETDKQFNAILAIIELPTPSNTKLNSRWEGGVPSPSPGGSTDSRDIVGSLAASTSSSNVGSHRSRTLELYTKKNHL